MLITTSVDQSFQGTTPKIILNDLKILCKSAESSENSFRVLDRLRNNRAIFKMFLSVNGIFYTIFRFLAIFKHLSLDNEVNNV